MKIKIINGDGLVLAENSNSHEIVLVYDGEYKKGDKIVVECEVPQFLFVRLDDCMEESFVFVKDLYELEIPFDEKKASYNPRCFTGNRHYLSLRKANSFEISQRRNLAFNPYDCHENKGLFPHTWANVETRGESVFASRNAIDGYLANTFHGEWPYSSWGINRNPDAEFHLDFGRKVKVDTIVIYNRADFPHDAWWEKATVDFSDGSSMELKYSKTGEAQVFKFEPKVIESLVLYKLIKAEDPSPFPALTQIQVYGVEA